MLGQSDYCEYLGKHFLCIVFHCCVFLLSVRQSVVYYLLTPPASTSSQSKPDQYVISQKAVRLQGIA